MPAVDVPADEEIVQAVVRNFRRVTGEEVNRFGAVLPLSYSACESSWLWQQGIPCLHNGPTTGFQVAGPEGAYFEIDQMEELAKVMIWRMLFFAVVCEIIIGIPLYRCRRPTWAAQGELAGRARR